MKATRRRASSRLLIIGAMMPAPPASSRRLASGNSPTGIRTIAGLPASATETIAREAPAKSSAPCCMSSTTASKASRASASATAGSFIPTQAQKTGASDASAFDSFPTTASIMSSLAFPFIQPNPYGEFI